MLKLFNPDMFKSNSRWRIWRNSDSGPVCKNQYQRHLWETKGIHPYIDHIMVWSMKLHGPATISSLYAWLACKGVSLYHLVICMCRSRAGIVIAAFQCQQ